MEEEKGDEVEAVEEAGKMYHTMQQAVGAWVATGDRHVSIGGGKKCLWEATTQNACDGHASVGDRKQPLQ